MAKEEAPKQYEQLDPQVVYISAGALELLKKEYLAQKERLEKINDEALVESDDEWVHHNEAARDARLEASRQEARLKQLAADISHAQIIAPRQETDSIDIGNTVVVQFPDESAPEQFTVLGQYDHFVDKSFISHQSPLGRALLGRKAGETASYTVDGKHEFAVLVKDVKPGAFV